MNQSLLNNYFKVSCRHLFRNKTYAIVNIVGLAVGMAATLLICDYARFETSFDDFHQQASNIYRVTTVWNEDKTSDDKRATTVAWSGPGVKDAFPEVVEFTRFVPLNVMSGNSSVIYKGEQIEEHDIYLADPGFLKIFSFPIIAGKPETALNEPGNIIITRTIAEKYFKDADPMDKVVELKANNLTTQNFKITAIIDDPPVNSHMQFDFIVAYSAIPKGLDSGSTYWHWDYAYCYLLLQAGTDLTEFERKMTDLRVQQFGKEFGGWNDRINFNLQRLSDIHLYSSLKSELSVNGDGTSIKFLLIIGICILLTAYFNYINLSTLGALQRRKEIGVRKVIGSTRKQLIMQTMIESVSMNAVALVLALILAAGGKLLLANSLSIAWPTVYTGISSLEFCIVILVVLAAGVLISTIYPAYVLTSFSPAEVLKASKAISPGGASRSPIRNILTVLQFSFCFVFVIGTFFLYHQLQFMKTHDLGMNMNQVIAVNGYGFQPYDDYLKFKHELESSPLISSVGYSTAAPGDEIMMLGLRQRVTVQGESISAELKWVGVDEDIFKTLAVNLLAGRNFDPAIKTDDDAVIINETAARSLGFTDVVSAIGQSLMGLNDHPQSKVIGVISNYHQRSLKNAFEPMVFSPAWKTDFGWNNRYYFVKLADFSPRNRTEVIDQLRKAWGAFSEKHPFNYFFVDTKFEAQYKQDATVGSLFMFFSGFSILIACLGLFGLVAFITLQRTKEIGIRKVLGASVRSILLLLSGDLARLIIFAAILSIPVTWYFGSRWLEGFAFRIDMKPALFIYPVACIFALASLTMIFKSLRVAMDNPVDSLRQE